MTLPKEFSKQISEFAPLFSKKVFEHAKVLLMGAILCVKARTVCSALRSTCLQDLKQFHKFHRVLSLSKWSSYKAAKVLLKMLLNRFIPKGQPIVFGIDETVERRWGQKIKARGIHRDAAGRCDVQRHDSEIYRTDWDGGRLGSKHPQHLPAP